MTSAEKPAPVQHFIRTKVSYDIASGRVSSVVTRFPPEPNGYLHIGHAKSIVLNFGLAQEYGGVCNLRYDDTNPAKEDQEYVDSIAQDVKWLGFDPKDRVFYASDYFEKLYQYAELLIQKGLAYVDSQSAEQIRASRGNLTQPGTASPYRNRSVDENLTMFRAMRAGSYADGEHVLRAKIDMASPNLNMRDPAIYRIRRAHHHRTGDAWCIYPMYDFAHGLSDAIEGVTNSICTLEFEDHRPLYDWFLDAVGIAQPRPEQTEFARLNLTYTVLSKRKLIELVEGKHVDGWDDPRMPTISGLRRRGVTPAALRNFCESIGVAKANSTVDYDQLAFSIREDLNKVALRRMAVLDPVKLVIENYPEGQSEMLEAQNNQEDPNAGTRQVPFGRELWIERDDFRVEVTDKGYNRLAPGREVRFMHAYYLTCTGYELDAQGQVSLIRCTYDPATRGGWSQDGRKVKGTIHWVSAAQAQSVEVRLYEQLFTIENPGGVADTDSYLNYLNPDSLRVGQALVEPALMHAVPGQALQFVRAGYFAADLRASQPGKPVFNRTIGLRDSYAAKAKT